MARVLLTREAAVLLVQQVMQAEGGDEESSRVLDRLDRALGCPSGYVSGLIFWPERPEPTAADVVEQALAYRPVAL
ncbi:e9imm peptide [Streptomyces sp. NPDC006733]|uniref:e9imm peptide n=1 Tax=Streptomyces sp. NPDC006733 TaxID=3155460 RepID=UPI0033E597A7